MKNTDLQVTVLFRKCLSPLLKILVFENKYEMCIKAPQFYTDLGLQKQY